MKFEQVTYQNFGPFKDVELSLDDRGLVLIQGDNRISPSADSNGSGKSFLLEGIVWSLFGKTIRGLTADDVINNKVKKNCFVHTKLNNNGQVIEIIRYRKAKSGAFEMPDGGDNPTGSGLLLFVDGTDMTRGTVKETDRMISELIGLDYSTFVRSVYFDGHEVVSMPKLTDKEIKDVFEKVLGLEDLKKVLDVIKRQKTDARGEVSLIENSLVMKRGELSTADVEIITARDRVEQHIKDTAASIADRESRLTSLQSEITPDSVFDDEEAGIAAREADILAKLQDFTALDGMISANNAKIDEVMQEIAKVEAQEASVRKQAANPASIPISEEMSTLQSFTLMKIDNAKQSAIDHNHTAENAQSKIGQPCGECGKVYVEDDLSSIVEHAKAHAQAEREREAELREKLTAINEEIRVLRQTSVDAFTDQADALKIGADKLREQLPTLYEKRDKFTKLVGMRSEHSQALTGLEVEKSAVNTRREANARLRASESALKAEIDQLRAAPNPYESDVERWTQRKVDLEAEITKLEADYKERMILIDHLEFLDKAYGRSGLKAHILETITPILNERANDYAGRLADGEVQIEFKTVTQNKDGSLSEKFSVDVNNSAGANIYLGNSSGERKKIDLAIAIAMSDLVAARASKSIDLWVADEIAESLDPTALERVVDLLHHKAQERGTLLTISHTDMKPYIPNVLTVQKTNDGSVLS